MRTLSFMIRTYSDDDGEKLTREKSYNITAYALVITLVGFWVGYIAGVVVATLGII